MIEETTIKYSKTSATARRAGGMPVQSFFSRQPCRRGFDVETAHRVPSPDQLIRGGIADRIPHRIINGAACVALDRRQRITDDGQGPIAQQIDLDQSGLFRLILLPLNHRQARGGDLDRHIAADFVRDQDHATRMQTQIPEMSLQLARTNTESPAMAL